MSRTRLILLAHGSRDDQWRKSFETFRDDVVSELGKPSVSLAYLELTAPTLGEAITEAAREGVERIRILPLFMALGKHLDRDIPRQIQEITAKYPKLKIELLSAITSHPAVYDAMKAVVKQAALD